MHPSVCVLNQHGRQLMPTTSRRAKLLLKQGKAKTASYNPYTIQLLVGTRGHVKPITLGLDAGYETVGFSAVSDKVELIGGELHLLEGMSQRLTEKRQYRRTRRNRLRHRAARFNNRRRPQDWLAPSIQHKLDSHYKLIDRFRAVLPISKIVVEVAPFDIQKLNQPTIEGTGYQQGVQFGFNNLRAYILHRDNYQCQNPTCKSKRQQPKLQVHHLGFWKHDHTDRPGNLITLCDQCHTTKNHQPSGLLFGWQPRVKAFKGETFMSTVWKRLTTARGYEQAFGFSTQAERQALDLVKSHHNDAFLIAGGTTQPRCQPLQLEQVRRHKRSMEQFYDAKYTDTRNGTVKTGSELASGRRTRNKHLNGENLRVYRGHKVSKGQRRIKRLRYRFTPGDLVQFEGKVFEVIGMQNLGKGVKLKNYPGIKNKVVAVSKVQPFLQRGGICAVTI